MPVTACLLVDLDGTLALRQNRSPYDWSRVDEDLPNAPVVWTVMELMRAGLEVVVVTGRDAICRPESEAWLQRVLGFGPKLLMRPVNDYRADYIVKEEIFLTSIKPYYDVRLVLDDRQQCVDLWRRLGLPTFQVAPGDF